MKKAAARTGTARRKKTKKAAPRRHGRKLRESGAKSATPLERREPGPKVSASLGGKPRGLSARLKPRVLVRTPYPTLEKTADTLGVSLRKAHRIRDLVFEELVHVDPETGALKILAPKPGGTLGAELATRKVLPRSGASGASRD